MALNVEIDIQTLFSRPRLPLLLREYVLKAFSPENLAFFLEIKQFNSWRVLDREILETELRLIYDKFIAEGSEFQVNFDQIHLRTLNERMKDPTPHVFEEIENWSYELLKLDSFAKFVTTEPFQFICAFHRSKGVEKNKETLRISIGEKGDLNNRTLEVFCEFPTPNMQKKGIFKGIPEPFDPDGTSGTEQLDLASILASSLAYTNQEKKVVNTLRASIAKSISSIEDKIPSFERSISNISESKQIRAALFYFEQWMDVLRLFNLSQPFIMPEIGASRADASSSSADNFSDNFVLFLAHLSSESLRCFSQYTLRFLANMLQALDTYLDEKKPSKVEIPLPVFFRFQNEPGPLSGIHMAGVMTKNLKFSTKKRFCILNSKTLMYYNKSKSKKVIPIDTIQSVTYQISNSYKFTIRTNALSRTFTLTSHSELSYWLLSLFGFSKQEIMPVALQEKLFRYTQVERFRGGSIQVEGRRWEYISEGILQDAEEQNWKYQWDGRKIQLQGSPSSSEGTGLQSIIGQFTGTHFEVRSKMSGEGQEPDLIFYIQTRNYLEALNVTNSVVFTNDDINCNFQVAGDVPVCVLLFAISLHVLAARQI